MTTLNRSLSSVTKKLLMSLAGLFLLVFLAIHASINFLILLPDNGEMYTETAHYMSTNPVLQSIQVLLFIAILLHAVYGIIVSIQNKKARPVAYKVKGSSEESFASKYMYHTGLLIGIFLVIHLYNFLFVKFGMVQVPEGISHKEDFYNMSILLFKNPYYVVLYVVSILAVGFHLSHAVQSAFQTLGLNHKKYTPIIRVIGAVYSILITLAFVLVPIVVYFCR